MDALWFGLGALLAVAWFVGRRRVRVVVVTVYSSLMTRNRRESFSCDRSCVTVNSIGTQQETGINGNRPDVLTGNQRVRGSKP